jgi:hypothetical protein
VSPAMPWCGRLVPEDASARRRCRPAAGRVWACPRHTETVKSRLHYALRALRKQFAPTLLQAVAGHRDEGAGWRTASRMISARDRAPSLARMCDTCVCTVLRDKNNSAATSGFDRPFATK